MKSISVLLAAVSAGTFLLRSVGAAPVVSQREFDDPEIPIVTRCVKKNDFMLTFHDGPSPLTKDILETLMREKVPATFFLNGNFDSEIEALGKNCIYRYTSLIRQAFLMGYTIGSHTWTHAKLDESVDNFKIRREVMRIEKAFVQILGVRPRLFSPPANYTDNLNALLPIKDRGYTIVGNNLDAKEKTYKDNAKSKEEFEKFVKQQPKPESGISLSRDLWEGNPASVIPEAIKLLKEAGYNLVGAEACLGLKSVYYQEEYEGLEKKLFPEAKPAWTDKDISCEEHLKG